MNTIVLRNPPGAARPSAGTWLISLRRFAESCTRAIRIRHQRRVLEQMPDFLLKDIGIDRSEIGSVVAAIVDGHPDRTRVSRSDTNAGREQ